MIASSSYLHLFAHVATQPESQLDLAQAALLIAEPEYPGLDIARYVAALEQFGQRAAEAMGGTKAASARTLIQLLYEDLSFVGNEKDYYDPRNSFLNEVLDRRTGIPITLAVVLLEVARRAGVAARGIGFPGHFLVQVTGGDGEVLIDPFRGAALDRAGLRQLMGRVSGQARDPEPALLAPVTKTQILVRMLNNLRSIYSTRGDRLRLRRTLEQMAVLVPSDEAVQRELGALGGAAYLGSRLGGRTLN